MNEGIADAQGEIIKVMHMDDWFCNPQALQKMVDGLLARFTTVRRGHVRTRGASPYSLISLNPGS
jgi:hypothetical protein